MTVIRFVAIAGPFVDPNIPEKAWLASFEDTPCGRGRARWTADPKKALIFPSFLEAFDFWRQRSTTVPIRDDGKPNRPLTAYTVEFEKTEGWQSGNAAGC